MKHHDKKHRSSWYSIPYNFGNYQNLEKHTKKAKLSTRIMLVHTVHTGSIKFRT